jgi:hypothetical protein
MNAPINTLITSSLEIFKSAKNPSFATRFPFSSVSFSKNYGSKNTANAIE